MSLVNRKPAGSRINNHIRDHYLRFTQFPRLEDITLFLTCLYVGSLSPVFIPPTFDVCPCHISTLDPTLKIVISQVIRIGAFQTLDMVLKLANEEQKKRRKSKKEHLFRDPTGLDYQMYSSAFLGWVKIQVSYRYCSIGSSSRIRTQMGNFRPV